MAEHMHNADKNPALIPCAEVGTKKDVIVKKNSTDIKKSPDILQQDFRKITRKHLWNQLDFSISDSSI